MTNSETSASWKKRARLGLEIGLSLLILLAAAWAPRVQGLHQYVTTDEHLWLTRSAQFYYALLHKDYAATYQKEHPGVTTMWAGAAGFARLSPEYRDRPVKQLNKYQFETYLTQVSDTSFLDILVAGRTFMVMASTLALLLGFLYARRLIGALPALVGFLLIALDPFHLALSRLLHLDGLLSSLMLLAVLSFLCYWKDRRIGDLILSGVVSGLTWLTKSPGLVLIPTVLLLAVWESWRHPAPSAVSKPRLRRIWELAWPLAVWGAAGCAVFIAAWPAMWVQPYQTLRSVLEMAQRYAQEGHDSAVFFNGEIIESGEMGLEYWYFYPLTYLWRSTPVTLLGLLLAIWAAVRKAYPFDQSSARLAGRGMVWIVLTFSLLMTVGTKKFDRYLIPIYPPLDLLAGMGWAAFAIWLAKSLSKWRAGMQPAVVGLLLTLVIAWQAALAYDSFPYYLSYYNPLMGGPRLAPQVMQIGWGEGLDQAGRYLNNKDNPRKLKAISWYALGSVSYYFPGDVRYFRKKPVLDGHELDKLLESDYAIIYVNQWQRNLAAPALEYLSQQSPEHTVWINGIEYARIYKLP
jgi:4-amino-4-deoxy-L-arabinose transferase-like glycosyltransferase